MRSDRSEKKLKSPFSLIAQYCIVGHHAGLPDGGTEIDEYGVASLYGKLSDIERFEDYSDYEKEIHTTPLDDEEIAVLFKDSKEKEEFIECFAFLTRYCFSCLTDADSLDTAGFCTGREDKELQSDFQECLAKINEKINGFHHTTRLQEARFLLQKQVYEKTDIDSEIYLINMPTGSGKTLCSMKFALERAIETGKKRIIYVIPYNSIIDQTVNVFEEIFGENANILRHQSSFCVDDTDFEEDYKIHLKNVTENWNAQIIVTTSVQFFESVYKNKRNRLRKMHNMADSIIIFDEAHMMPAEYLQPCLKAVSYITKLLGSEAVFLTATMPDFQALVKKYALPTSVITDLITDKSLFGSFKKGDFVDIGEINCEQLIAHVQRKPAALIVVNKRATASKLYDMIGGIKFHLSTYMSAFDRKRTIDEINRALDRLYADYPNLEEVPEDRKITVISTSLIEAGVDLDFYTVYRELNGLDNILQAGGRCNREGKRDGAEIYVFDFGAPSTAAKTNITKKIMERYEDISSPECIDEYYHMLFDFHHALIAKNTIAYQCAGPDAISFATYAVNFNMIESNTVAVAVECDDESRDLIGCLQSTGYTNQRKLQKYTFTVYEHELAELLRQGAVKEYGGIYCLVNPDYYSREKGVTFEAKDYIV